MVHTDQITALAPDAPSVFSLPSAPSETGQWSFLSSPGIGNLITLKPSILRDLGNSMIWPSTVQCVALPKVP